MRKMPSLSQFVEANGRVFWGWFFLVIGSFSFVGFFYAAGISKLQPPSDNAIIRAIQNDWYFCNDFVVLLVTVSSVIFIWMEGLEVEGFKFHRWYYCFLVPLTLPILFVAVYFHWLSMKLFKHA